MKNKKISVFDFDGTLIKGDSIKLYCNWLSSNIIEFYLIYHLKFRLMKLFNFKLDIKHERVKFFHNRQINNNIEEFNEILKESLFDDSLDMLKRDLSNLKVYVVSASFYEIIGSFCNNHLNINLITNDIKTYNTSNDINFKNKVIALNSLLTTGYDIVRGYGNSPGDLDFMNISDEAFLRLPNGKIEIWKK